MRETVEELPVQAVAGPVAVREHEFPRLWSHVWRYIIQRRER